MKLIFILWILFQSAYAIELKHHYEVTADNSENIAFMTGSGSTPNFYGGKTDVSCGYIVDGKEINFRGKGYSIGGNPVITNNGNKVFIACMSVNLDYSAGSLDLAVYDLKTRTLGSWKNIIKTSGTIPDKPSLAINDSDVIVISFIDVQVSNGIKSSLKILRSDDLGDNWKETRLAKSAPATEQMIHGEQGNFTWSEGNRFYTSYSFYEKPVVEVIYSTDNARTFSPFIKFISPALNVEMAPPVTKPVLSQTGELKAIQLYFGHSFGTAVVLPYVDQKIGPPIIISRSSTMVDAKFLLDRFYVIETKLEENNVRTYF